MQRVLTQLRVNLASPGRWRLADPLSYRSTVLGEVVTVPAGFLTDFASVPRLPIVFWLFGDTAEEAAVVHDWLYYTAKVPRQVADQVFLEAALATGVPGWRAYMMYLGLRVFGGERYGVGSPDPV